MRATHFTSVVHYELGAQPHTTPRSRTSISHSEAVQYHPHSLLLPFPPLRLPITRACFRGARLADQFRNHMTRCRCCCCCRHHPHPFRAVSEDQTPPSPVYRGRHTGTHLAQDEREKKLLNLIPHPLLPRRWVRRPRKPLPRPPLLSHFVKPARGLGVRQLLLLPRSNILPTSLKLLAFCRNCLPVN